VTARWVVEEVAPARDLTVRWRPISLLFKNDPDPSSKYYGSVVRTHKMLRVMESVRAAEGDAPLQALYWEFGTRVHHDRVVDFAMADALQAVGLDTRHADAFDDELWDVAVRAGHDDGLSLVGGDVGTPIIALPDGNGGRIGIFGPVITRVPSREQSLQLWDGMVACMTVPGFWELKRTRTESPDMGPHPRG
jgi:hypothetical protein